MSPRKILPRAIFLASVFIASCARNCEAQPGGVLRGAKIDARGQPFTSPGATISVKASPSGAWRATFSASNPNFEAPLPAGKYEVGAQIPDGYTAYYSLCHNCADHPPKSYTPYGDYNDGRVVVTIPANQYVDVSWRFVSQTSPRLPVSNELTKSSPLEVRDARIAADDVNQTLACNVPGMNGPAPATDAMTFKGASDVWVRAGVNRDLGGIGVLLELINPRAPERPLQVIDARSAGGAAWQSTIGLIQRVGSAYPIAHFNQGAGNFDLMWGFGSEFATSPEAGIVQKKWIPLWSNDIETGVGTGSSLRTNPCYHTGIRFGNGRLRLTPSYTPVIVDGRPRKVLRLTWQYEFKSVGAHPFTSSFVPSADEQALYFLRAATGERSGDLRVYFLGADDRTILGPVAAHDAFASPPFETSAIARLNCPPDPTKACFLKTKPTKWAVLVWKVAGQDIGMVISGENTFQNQTTTRFVGVLNLRQSLICRDPQNDSCGNVQWHSVFNLPADGVIGSGDAITQRVNWDIGTLPQLRALGVNIPE